MFRKNKDRGKKEFEELDITSLLDILVILLVFLLKSYNASDLKLDLVDSLMVPGSKSQKMGNHAVIIQVNKDAKVWLNNQEIAEVDWNTEKIDALYAQLELEFQKNKENEEEIKKMNKSIHSINLVFDENIKYENIQKVMHTSALAGFKEFKLIVKGNY